jgi:anti-anti-sigma factor
MGPGIRSRPLDAIGQEIVLAGRLHAGSVAELRRILDDASSRGGLLLLDATALESVDAIALRVVVDAVKRLRPSGGTVTMFGVRPTVRRMLQLTAVDRLVTVRDSREEALAELA